jgi:hypothetical protein
MANPLRTRRALAPAVAAAALLALVAATAAGAAKSAREAHAVSNSVAALRTAPYALVGLDRVYGATAVPALRAAGGVELSHRLRIWRLPSSRAVAVIPTLQRAGLLRAFQPDRVLVPAASPFQGADEMLPYEWWLAKVGADRAPEPPGPGKPITVIDSGIRLDDLDLLDRDGQKIWDVTPLNRQETAKLDEWHGTQVAEVIGAPANDVGLVGVYPRAKLYSYDATLSGALTTSALIDGLDRAARLGPGIVNLSLGGELRQPLEEEVILDAFDRGLIVVAAAGNSWSAGSPNEFPANYSHVVTVAATDPKDFVADFSTQSRGIDLAAPGVGIVASVSDDAYGPVDGTSFSAPIVSGAAAWLWSARPELDKTQVIELLRSTARDVGKKGRDADTGFGVLDIPAALAAPAPAVDPSEPNDDVDQVDAGGIFGRAKASVVGPKASSASFPARLDAVEDPKDVYRVWVRRGQRVTASITGGALASAPKITLEIWRPDTETVWASGWHRRNDIAGAATWKGSGTTTVAAANTGARAGSGYFYVVVSIPESAALGSASYNLTVKTGGSGPAGSKQRSS